MITVTAMASSVLAQPAPTDAAPVAQTRTPPSVDPTTVPLPALVFTETPEIAADYDKYFYFHRADNDFPTALADITDCDALANGLVYSVGNKSAPYPYAGTMAGAVGSAIGDAMSDAIYGSTERRKMRRINMRRCMNFKGYDRYGLEKSLWQAFNFEEGLSAEPSERRIVKLNQQARVASGPLPATPKLGL